MQMYSFYPTNHRPNLGGTMVQISLQCIFYLEFFFVTELKFLTPWLILPPTPQILLAKLRLWELRKR